MSLSSSMNASVASADDLADYDIISEGPRSLESSITDLPTDVPEPAPLPAAKDKFDTVCLTADEIQKYVRKALEGRSPAAIEYSEHRHTRVYVDGIFDGLHAGHGLQLRQAKLSFPSTCLVVGVFPDALCRSHDMPAIRPHVERCEVVRHCRWVDEVISDAPWTLDDSYLRMHRIDYVAINEGTTVDPAYDKARLKGYDALKSTGKVIPTRRTLGLAPTAPIVPSTPRPATVPVPRRESSHRAEQERESAMQTLPSPFYDQEDPPPADVVEPWTRPQSPDHEPLIAFET